jgi:hypothetical protein
LGLNDGGNVGTTTPYRAAPPNQNDPFLALLGEESPISVNGQRVTCNLDGLAVGCYVAFASLNNGSAVPCPHNDCGPRVFTVNGQRTLSHPFTAYADGTSGYRVPVWQANSITIDHQTSSFGSQIIGWTFKAAASNGLPQTTSTTPTPQGNITAADANASALKAINRAKELLKNKECNDAVSSSFADGKTTLTEAFNNEVIYLKQDEVSGNSIAKTFPPIPDIYNGFVELYKPFFFRAEVDIGNSNSINLKLTDDDLRVLTILHELSHLTRRYVDVNQGIPGAGLIFDEIIPEGDISTINGRIYKACFRNKSIAGGPSPANRAKGKRGKKK